MHCVRWRCLACGKLFRDEAYLTFASCAAWSLAVGPSQRCRAQKPEDVAQLVEQLTFNQLVPGSSPGILIFLQRFCAFVGWLPLEGKPGRATSRWSG